MGRTRWPGVFIAAGLLAGVAFAAPSPTPKEPKEKVKQVKLPAGPVKMETVKTKEGRVVRITAGKVVVEGKRLFYGDGKVAAEIVATEKGMRLDYWCGEKGPSKSSGPDSDGDVSVRGGTYTHGPKAVWFVTRDAPAADKLPPGSTYVVTPSVEFRRR
jgi:hypothetical protein